MAGKKIVLWFEYALLALGIGLLVYVATSYAVVAAYQRYLERIFLGDPPPPTKARVAIPPKDGSPVGRLEIPRLNVSVSEIVVRHTPKGQTLGRTESECQFRSTKVESRRVGAALNVFCLQENPFMTARRSPIRSASLNNPTMLGPKLFGR